MSIVAILGYLVYFIILINFFRSISVIRNPVREGIGITKPTVNIHMLSFISLIVIPLVGLPPLHLVWMIPLSFLFGYYSYVAPLSLLNIPGALYARLVCIGIQYEEIFKEKIIEKGFEEITNRYLDSIKSEDKK